MSQSPVTTHHTSVTNTHVGKAVSYRWRSILSTEIRIGVYAEDEGQIEICVAGHFAAQAEDNLHHITWIRWNQVHESVTANEK